MKKIRKISTIRFFRREAKSSPQYGDDKGFNYINGKWMCDCVEIDGIEPDCPAIDINEFQRMLHQAGDYEPFTCTCSNAGCAFIDFPVRCYHKGNVLIMIIRDPLRRVGPCSTCQYSSKTCPVELDYFDCPYIKYQYKAYLFLKEDMRLSLIKMTNGLK